MIEPRRPDPVLSWHQRLRARIERTFDRRRDRSVGTTFDGQAMSPTTGPSLLVTVLLAFGSAALALVGLWAWQAWSQRSSEPIDDLLPILVAAQGEESIEINPGTDPNDVLDTASAGATGAGARGETFAEPGVSTAPGTAAGPETADEPKMIIVHVSGAVADPGVVTVPAGARVFQAVDGAGGASADADLNRVNLAAALGDGEHIHVPEVGEDVLPELVPTSSAMTGSDAAPAAEPILDINTATADDLESLPGIGPSIAEAIVQTRTERGPYLSVEELLEVPGIGDAKLALVSPYVMVGR